MQKNMQGCDDLFDRLMESYIAGVITDAEKSELFSLIRESEEYRRRYHEMAKVYALLHVPALEAEKDRSYQRFSERLHEGSAKKKQTFRLVFRFAAVAVILMALASSVSVYLYKLSSSVEKEFLCEAIVPFGNQTKIILPDSTIVMLNSGSILKYPASFGDKERNVYLAGEAYFKVTKDKSRIFQVIAGETNVRVTGTVFNVRSYPEDVQTEVDLIQGGVDVFIGDKTIQLKPDEKAVYNRETGSLERVACEAYKSALWTTGKLSFVNASFLDILKEIERKYNVKIRVMSTKLENEFFSGTINTEMPLQRVFNFIDVDKKYVFEYSENTIVLKDR